MSQRNLIELPATPIIFASPAAMSDYESELFLNDEQYFADDERERSPNEQYLTEDIPTTPLNTASPISSLGSPKYSDRIECLVARFHRCLNILEARAQANTAQGEASKSKPQPPTTPSALNPSHQANANGFGGGKVICHIMISEAPAALERRILQESTFKLQPAPLWARKSKATTMSFKEIEVGSDYRNPEGVAGDVLLAPKPTAKVSSWLQGIPGTHPAFDNLFEAEGPLDLRLASAAVNPTASPRLSGLDSFTNVFEMPGFERDLSFEVPDPRTRALFLMRDVADVLIRLAGLV